MTDTVYGVRFETGDQVTSIARLPHDIGTVVKTDGGYPPSAVRVRWTGGATVWARVSTLRSI